MNDQIETLSEPQLLALVDAAERSKQPERDLAIFLLLLDTGIRARELCALTVADAILPAREVAIRWGTHGKARTVYVVPDTAKALTRYLRTREGLGPDGPLFLGDDRETGLTEQGLRQLLRRLATDAGIEGVKVTPGVIRDTYAVMCLRSGMTVTVLSALLGPASLRACLRYAEAAGVSVPRKSVLESILDRGKPR